MAEGVKETIIKVTDAPGELQHRGESEHRAAAPTFLRPEANGPMEPLPSSLSSWPLSPAFFLESLGSYMEFSPLF